MQFNVSSFLSTQAKRDPKAKAIVYPFKPYFWARKSYTDLSFNELNTRVDALIYQFLSSGVKRETRVLLLVKPGVELIQIVFALLKLGAVPVVIDPGMGLGRFFECAKQSKVRMIIGGTIAITLAKWFLRRDAFAKNVITLNEKFKRKLKKHFKVHSYNAYKAGADDLAAILSQKCVPREYLPFSHCKIHDLLRMKNREKKSRNGERRMT